MIQQDIINSIKKMSVNGNRLELPVDDYFANYAAVKKALIAAGGVYKKNGFVFSHRDPEDVQNALCSGEVINDKKNFQFFSTPVEVADYLIELAELEPENTVLEPSAGQGAIVNRLPTFVDVYLVELMENNCQVLERLGWSPVKGDFLKMTPIEVGTFDRVIANPPFSKGQDIAHIQHMYSFLKPGGRIVTVASPSWEYNSFKKYKQFREFLNGIEHQVIPLPDGSFKSSGTLVSACIIIINKSEEEEVK